MLFFLSDVELFWCVRARVCVCVCVCVCLKWKRAATGPQNASSAYGEKRKARVREPG